MYQKTNFCENTEVFISRIKLRYIDLLIIIYRQTNRVWSIFSMPIYIMLHGYYYRNNNDHCIIKNNRAIKAGLSSKSVLRQT